jgi:ABC-type multidrug transport system fused ATPase/permease subunit
VPVLHGEVALQGVTFAYGPDVPPAVEGLDLTLRRGERVALVGASGAGKSTLFQLLLGLRRPDRGQILCDGLPLASAASLRGQLAWVGQEPFLFDGTVAENITLGHETGDVAGDHERLRLAAERSQSLGLIERLGGFEAQVGERGRRLSGGERQRLSIARALYRDAPLLLLDEPTSHLDAENERALRSALDELVKERTVLLIAHRLATVRGCERAVVLERGRVVEEGPPEELLAANGRFAALFAEDLWRDRAQQRAAQG